MMKSQIETDPDRMMRQFCEHYNAEIRRSQRVFRRYDPYKIQDYTSPAPIHLETREVPMVEVLMPEDRFKHLVEMDANYLATMSDAQRYRMENHHYADEISAREREASKLRHEYPMCKHAYDNYIKLVEENQARERLAYDQYNMLIKLAQTGS